LYFSGLRHAETKHRRKLCKNLVACRDHFGDFVELLVTDLEYLQHNEVMPADKVGRIYAVNSRRAQRCGRD
jgi:hypothetical protein